jgi:hypothetical protein
VTLFDGWSDPKLEVQFQAFHAAHPEVYDTLCRLARRLVRRGYRHLGIGMLWETMRYRTMLGASPEEDAFRLNNNHRSRYARLIMEQEPDLRGMFELRELRSL